MHNNTKKLLSGILTGAVFSIVFLSIVVGAIPAITGEVGVPPTGYLSYILSNKVLVNNNFTTTNGQVKNSEKFDGFEVVHLQKRVTGACNMGEWAIGVNTDNSIKCSSTGGSGSYNCSALGGVNAGGNNGCDWVFTNTGTVNWTVPTGVTSISAVAVGGGGGPACLGVACGGGGGALGWKNNISVTPGQVLVIIVGDGGYNNGVGGHQPEEDGGLSAIRTQTGIKLLEVSGGKQSDVSGIGGSGGVIIVADGGGAGGKGGDYSVVWAGGGGAGGYTGVGGRGAYSSAIQATAGIGGGGGGGGVTVGGWSSAGGGGVGIYGAGSSGARGTNAAAPRGGGGGSNGDSGYDGASSLPIVNHGNGGLYGGGAGANSGESSKGAKGAVRIIWGAGRSFPDNAQ